MTARTVLALTAHPDDAEWYAGGTLARFAAEGARVIIVIATDGRRGTFTHSPDTLVALRRAEAERAAAVLGAEAPAWLGHPDFELDTLPPGYLREQFIGLIRRHRPDVVVSGDALHPDIHPDHRAVAWAAAEAVAFAHLPLLHPEQVAAGAGPHLVAEKYYYGGDAARTNCVIDVTDTFATKLRALAAHESQVAFLVEDILRQARLAGLESHPLYAAAQADPLAALAQALEAEAAAVGARAGFQRGEAFRRERYHPLVQSELTAE